MLGHSALRRLGRIREKFRSLHRSSGSLPRAVFYVVKFMISKVPFLYRHALATLRVTVVRRELEQVRARECDRAVIAIRVSGGLGDYLVAIRFIRDLLQQSEPFSFHLYCSQLKIASYFSGVLKECQGVHSDFLFERLAPAYDLALSISQFIVVHKDIASQPSGRWPQLARAAQRIQDYRAGIADFITSHPLRDGELARYAVTRGFTRAGIAGIVYGGDECDVPTERGLLDRLGLHRHGYVTVHNGFDPNFVVTAKVATKCYPHFGDVVQRLRMAYPDLLFVQVGTTTSMPIPDVDLDLRNRTTVAEAAGLLQGARLHLDNEGGLVHLARCLGVNCCVVFGPTSVDYFGYSANVNIAPPFCGDCWWSNETWMDVCPRGYGAALCMIDQPPERVAVAAIAALGRDRLPFAGPSIRELSTETAQHRA